MRPPRSRPGFVFLLSVLAIGVIATAATVSLLMLGGGAERTAYSLQESMQALEFAQSCAERALLSLRTDLTYAGGEAFSWTRGSCTLHRIGGAGNANRTICVEGRSGEAVRKMEVRVAQLFPKAVVASWQEVTSISLCP